MIAVFLVAIVICFASFASSQEDPRTNVHYRALNRDRCTSIGVGKLAMADGSTVTTHNNDCQECDIRITHVPARDWPAGSRRPVLDIRAAYPRYLEVPGEDIHGPDYDPELIDTSIYNWTARSPYFYIDQVPHTYAYTLGTYAIQNEKQVSIGESTCSSVFVGKPVYAGGKAVFHMETLTEIALERCATARCAVQMMGDLSVQYGFYGPEFDGPIESAQDEAGEALTVSDPDETWMFHVMPDDTGASAIWVAQRVPDDHITAVANQFVIGPVDLTDSANFIGSDNLYSVAIANKLWDSTSGVPFNFAVVYGTNRHETSFACTRRVWRVLTLAAPSLLPTFSAYTDGLQSFGFGPNGDQPYPFSVKVDTPLAVTDIMRMNRDQFEGTDFDMSDSLGGGVFGDTMRYPPTSKLHDPENGVSWEEYMKGLGDQRPISLFRTAYSTITQSRRNLPDVIGAVTWIAQYAPHHSTFVPVYASADKTPSSLNIGTQYKMEKQSNWWIHCLTGNYLSRWYRFTIGDVRAFQTKLETRLTASSAATESRALKIITGSNNAAAESLSNNNNAKNVKQEAISLLTRYHEVAATGVRDAWWDFFFEMAGKYRDMYMVDTPHAENFAVAYRYLTVSRQWMELMGFWGVPGTPPPGESQPVPVRPLNVPSLDSQEEYKERYPNGFTAPYPQSTVYGNDSQQQASSPPKTYYFALVTSMVFGIVIGVSTMMLLKRRDDYLPISESSIHSR